MKPSSSFAIRCLVLLVAATLTACGVSPQKVTVPVVERVDLPRFMGPWYVVGVIPTFIEKDIYNAIESYRLAEDGTIETTFTFNKGAFDGPAKEMNPRGFVIPGTNNAIWGMQFIWPIKAEYVISYLDDNYTETIIARSARDYVWIMARTPTISDERYAALTAKVEAMGYDLTQLVKIPQRPAVSAAAPIATPPTTALPSPERVAEILATVPAVSATDLRRRLQGPAAPVVLDVRSAGEFAAGHVPTAVNVAHGDILARPDAALGAVSKEADIVLYCGSGRRAAAAIEVLRQAGYSRLSHLEGDYPGWQASSAQP